MILSFIEGTYLFYMFSHFKTRYSIHHPLEYIYNKYDFIKHPISTGLYENKICDLGDLVSKLLFFWFIIRHFIKNNILMNKINTLFIVLLFIGSLVMNMNAFIYILPIIIFEMYNYKYLITY